jgi:hypothetical protein
LSSLWWHETRSRRSLRVCGALASVAVAGACYGFAGGGFAPHIKTVAILPFDNLTPEPALTLEVNAAVRQAMEDRLGLRPAGEPTADALVRGRIVRYDPDVPTQIRPGEGDLEVTRRQVQITIELEILDQRDGSPLWRRPGITVVGEYAPPAEADGRRLALEKLVDEIVQGAQSQW